MATRAKRTCQVCEHPSRMAIDQAVLNGKALRAIARDFGIGSNVGTEDFRPDHKKLSTHVDRCMGEAYQAAKAADLEASGLALVNRLKHLDDVVDEVIARHREGVTLLDRDDLPVLDPRTGDQLRAHNDTALLRAIGEARRNTELRAKLAGAVPDGDPEGLEKSRQLLASPAARRLLAELDALTHADDQDVAT